VTAASRAHRRLSDGLDGQFTPIDDSTATQWRAAGWWENRSLRSLLSEAAAKYPDRVALVGHRSTGGRVSRSYREFDTNAHHAASVLAGLGVGVGDAVVLMLPNWVEYPEIVFGINEIGAVYAGIPVGYGHLQAAAILRRSKAKVLVIPRRWRSNEHLALSRALRAEIPTLQHVVVLDDDGSDLRDGESLWRDHAEVPTREFPDPTPSRICYLASRPVQPVSPKGPCIVTTHCCIRRGVKRSTSAPRCTARRWSSWWRLQWAITPGSSGGSCSP
jgi:cyclohexanecarboxylate-CoA ligase